MSFDFQGLPFALFVSLAVVSIYAIRTIRRPRADKFPPGPKGVPFFGNLFQLSMMPWKEFDLWKPQYGPLMYITAAGQGILVINTHKVAVDLLDRRGHIYSDRPRMILASEIFTAGLVFVFAKYGETWRKMRRACQGALTKKSITEFYPLQSKEAARLISGMLQNPCSWDSEFRRAAASTMLSVVYDLPTIDSVTDPTIVTINSFTDTIADYGRPGNYLVEFFTWMKYIPSWMAKWKRDAEKGFKYYSEIFEGMFHDVEKRINEGDERPSFSGSLIRERQRHGLNDLEASWLATTMYGAGSETTSATMVWFMLAMTAYPEKQKKCQEELDAVVGRSRMPTFTDQSSLPYLRATVREVLRWRPATPLGIQHCTAEDDWYQGFFIPKDTMCLANIWSMNRDRDVYGHDADEFNPDRFLDEYGQLSPALPDTKDEGHVTYGFGPRICVGRHMANNSLFINIASILWAADIGSAKDEAGKPILPDTLETVDDGLVIRPLPFNCSIIPRFPEAQTIIAQTRELLQ